MFEGFTGDALPYLGMTIGFFLFLILGHQIRIRKKR